MKFVDGGNLIDFFFCCYCLFSMLSLVLIHHIHIYTEPNMNIWKEIKTLIEKQKRNTAKYRKMMTYFRFIFIFLFLLLLPQQQQWYETNAKIYFFFVSLFYVLLLLCIYCISKLNFYVFQKCLGRRVGTCGSNLRIFVRSLPFRKL